MTEKLTVRFRGHTVGSLSFTPDNRLNVFEYDKSWITAGFSISPFELPLKPGIFIAKPHRFMAISEYLKTVCPTATDGIFFTRHCFEKA